MSPVLDSPPPLPDAVKNQMGGPDKGPGGMAGAGEMLKKSTAFGGAPNAQGALRAQVDAIKGVLQKVIDTAGPGKQFFSRASQLIEQGMAAEASSGPGPEANPKAAQMGGSDETTCNKPPGSFPG